MQKNLYDLTYPQKSIWYTEQAFKDTPISNITGTVILKDKVDVRLLSQAINIFVKRNDSFRLKFCIENQKVQQYVEPYSQFPIEVVNVRSDNDLHRLEQKNASTVFNIFFSYLFTFKIIRFKDGHGGFIINMHHLISDAWSAGLGGSEIIKIYSRLVNKESLDDISYPSYVEYIAAEHTYLSSTRHSKDKEFWNNVFETVPEVATIPYQIAETNNTSNGISKRKQISVSKDLIDKINVFCKSSNISMFDFFMGIYSIYIGRTSGLDEFVIGTPILNRSNIKEKHTSGMFINTIPLKISLKEQPSFIDLVKNISHDLFDVFKHQKYQYLSIIENLRKKDNTIPNLYNILISYQNIRSTAQNTEAPFSIDWIPNGYIADDIQIHIYDMNNTGALNIAYDYQTSKYSETEINNINSRILNIVEQVLQNSALKSSEIDIITLDEKQKIIYTFNDTAMEYPKDMMLSQLFEKQVEKTPDNIALVFNDQQLTYKELNKKANSLANHLRKNGIDRGSIVGIMTKRSFEMIIGILAVLKAGGTYIPIDPEYPQDRVEYMLTNSKASLLLTQRDLKDKVSFNHKLFIDLTIADIYKKCSSNLPNINQPDDLAYIIFTSGSTGLPKGVMLKNRNIVNFINSVFKTLNFNSKQTIISITTISFDIFVLESLLPLLNGMKVVIASELAQTDAQAFGELCNKYNVDIIQTTPSRMQAFLFNEDMATFIKSVKYLLIGGEPFPPQLLKKLNTIYNGKIYNMYGPTETAVWSSIKDLTNTNKITIGTPIGNTQMYILDKFKMPLPVGIPGDLYISGDGVCKGYLHKADLTSQMFTPNPFVKGLTMYKTGDFCKLLPNGEISYLERIDNQVKIRGLRIELGEIEFCIASYPDINKCVVVVNDDAKLIAYFTANKTINPNDLKVFLQQKLPAYFIPNLFMQVDKFKMTPNGKVDRKSLAKVKVSTSTEYEAPSNGVQKKLVKIFQKVLGLNKVGINDNFFDIGGDSLAAIKLQIEAFNAGVNISYKDIFNYPTVKALSKKIGEPTRNSKKNTEEEYDYSKINSLLSKNVINGRIKMKKNNIKNILLTGTTGYMGSHILDYLIKHTKSNVYCLIRTKNNTDPQTRLLDTLKFYFGNKYDKLIFKRIFAVEGDITKNRLGLTPLYYNEIGSSIDCVINSAAIVKHYGNPNLFNDTNIKGTENVISFCEKFNCQLIHLSTLSISGNIFNDDVQHSNRQILFTERNLFINQDLTNIYVKTKFLAERLVLEHILNNNLNAKIVRLGNITNRFSDGAFQINLSENAFMNRIHSFISIGAVPNSLKSLPIEFSPVDLCANAIVNLIKYENSYTVFHVFNNNIITFEELVKKLNNFKINLKFVKDDEFNKKIQELSNDNEKKNIISGIVSDFSRDKKIKYVTNIKMDNSFTNKYLRKTLFRWPKINEKYIQKYVEYLKSIQYI